MEKLEFGKIKVISGDRGGRFPYCNSLLIDDAIKAVVDPGAGHSKMAKINDRIPIELVFNTHYHFDHITFNHVFSTSKIYLNEIEGGCFRNREEIARRLGITEVMGEGWTVGWLERIARPDSVQSLYSPQNRHEWWLSTARLDGTYEWGDVFDFGVTKMEIIGTPGHTAGFSCFYFPDEGVVYTGDIDLTGFGPFYGGSDGDIGLFIDSAGKITSLDADFFITGHEEGVLSRGDFIRRLERYLDIIDNRDQRIISALSTPLNVKEITGQGLIYGKRFLVDDWLRVWEEWMVKHHLRRLLGRGAIELEDGKYKRK